MQNGHSARALAQPQVWTPSKGHTHADGHAYLAYVKKQVQGCLRSCAMQESPLVSLSPLTHSQSRPEPYIVPLGPLEQEASSISAALWPTVGSGVFCSRLLRQKAKSTFLAILCIAEKLMVWTIRKDYGAHHQGPLCCPGVLDRGPSWDLIYSWPLGLKVH